MNFHFAARACIVLWGILSLLQLFLPYLGVATALLAGLGFITCLKAGMQQKKISVIHEVKNVTGLVIVKEYSGGKGTNEEDYPHVFTSKYKKNAAKKFDTVVIADEEGDREL